MSDEPCGTCGAKPNAEGWPSVLIDDRVQRICPPCWVDHLRSLLATGDVSMTFINSHRDSW
jgi:hypothetical protein